MIPYFLTYTVWVKSMNRVFFITLLILFLVLHTFIQDRLKNQTRRIRLGILLLPELGLLGLSFYLQSYTFFLEVIFAFQAFLLMMNTLLDLFYYKRRMYQKLRLRTLYFHAILLYLFVALGSSLEHKSTSFILPIGLSTLIILLCFLFFLFLLPRDRKEKAKFPVEILFLLPLFVLFPIVIEWYGTSFFHLPMSYLLGMLLALPHVFTLHDFILHGEVEENNHYLLLEWMLHFLLIAFLDIGTSFPIYLVGTETLTRFSKLGLYSIILIAYAIFNKKAKGIFYMVPSLLILICYFYFLILA